MKKKLLIATDGFLPRWDGIARFLSDILPYIKNDYDITVIAPICPEFKDYKDENNGYKIIRIPTYWFKLGDYYPPQFKYKIISDAVKDADIVWTHAIMPIGVLAIHYASKYKKNCVATIHSFEWELAMNSLHRKNIFRKPAYFLSKKLAVYWYNKCDLLMVSNRETGEILSYQGIKTPKKIVHLGTNINHFIPPEDKMEAKSKISLNPDIPVIGYCGRIGREKDVPTLLRAFKRLKKDNEEVVLLIVGKGVKDDLKIVEGLKDVKLVGAQDNVVPYLQAMDIYVLPSLTETTSLSTLEAMSCGLAIVATRVGYVKQYIKDKINGIFFPKGNDTVLYLKLKWLLNNQAARGVMGQIARQTVVNYFNWDMTVKDIKETLKKVL